MCCVSMEQLRIPGTLPLYAIPFRSRAITAARGVAMVLRFSVDSSAAGEVVAATAKPKDRTNKPRLMHVFAQLEYIAPPLTLESKPEHKTVHFGYTWDSRGEGWDIVTQDEQAVLLQPSRGSLSLRFLRLLVSNKRPEAPLPAQQAHGSQSLSARSRRFRSCGPTQRSSPKPPTQTSDTSRWVDQPRSDGTHRIGVPHLVPSGAVSGAAGCRSVHPDAA